MRTVADLHSHSLFSDGSLTLDSVTEVIRNRNLSAFSVTDHDSLEFYRQEIQPDIKSRLIPGTELSTHFKSQSVHLLVYCPWPIPESLQQLVNEFAVYRKSRFLRICQDLSKLYPQWDWTSTSQTSQFTSRSLCQFISKRTEQKSLRLIYNKYLSKIDMGYEEFPELSELLRRLQNIDSVRSFIAHPGYRGKLWESFWSEWKSLGLTGLELIHPIHKKSLRNYYKKILKREGLIGTGGSDFHFPGGGAAGPGRMGLDTHQWKNFRQQCQLLNCENSYTKN
tara:strand:- start:1110 stop:1949 length:840 start_codon:yes stop_codon:yes gene_type:complete